MEKDIMDWNSIQELAGNVVETIKPYLGFLKLPLKKMKEKLTEIVEESTRNMLESIRGSMPTDGNTGVVIDSLVKSPNNEINIEAFKAIIATLLRDDEDLRKEISEYFKADNQTANNNTATATGNGSFNLANAGNMKMGNVSYTGGTTVTHSGSGDNVVGDKIVGK
jgi:transcriptional regulator of met regulon